LKTSATIFRSEKVALLALPALRRVVVLSRTAFGGTPWQRGATPFLTQR
jgi:hypothetical protein